MSDQPGEDREPDPLRRLLDLLDLEQIEKDRFRGINPEIRFASRVFGGQVAAQALRAAAHTVEVEHSVHSLHSYFLRPGVPGIPIEYEVDRIRDGRSFTTRLVVAHQGEEAIFNLSASFHRREAGVDYQAPIAPDAPGPDDASVQLGLPFPVVREQMPVELRELGTTEPDDGGFYRSTRRAWIRTRGVLPDDAVLHACVIAFISDMGAVMGARAPLPEQPWNRLMGASLDHALWFHRPVRADEWLLYDLQAVSNYGARGFTRGTLHTQDGVLGASVSQEALLRVVPPERASLPVEPPSK
ncbi:MAG: Acyl-CoA thioesterase 2 [Acidimicrobiales bacterium]|nr:MAG: acyl-CoA thioesterase II [Actinomycetota bacterium]MBV6509325.1 Acyl-CoA thioesterase 2 [Acidimicrobiales bacterium]RIK04635.1 MAG: acyl-CoA thioesterase II [Acidobacteriota bacterium]